MERQNGNKPSDEHAGEAPQTEHRDGDHPGARECSKEGCESVRMNIVPLGGDTNHMVTICAKCGRINLNPKERVTA